MSLSSNSFNLEQGNFRNVLVTSSNEITNDINKNTLSSFINLTLKLEEDHLKSKEC